MIISLPEEECTNLREARTEFGSRTYHAILSSTILMIVEDSERNFQLLVNCYRGRRVAEFPSSPKLLFGFNLKLLKVTNFTEMQTKIFAKLINWATKCKQWTVLSYLFAISIINAQTIIAKALLDHTIHLPQQYIQRE